MPLLFITRITIVNIGSCVVLLFTLPNHIQSILSRNVPMSLLFEFGENPGLDQSSTRNHYSVNLELNINQQKLG